MKRGPKNAYTLIGRAVERDRSADHGRFGVEMAAPESIGQDDHSAATGIIFFRKKIAAKGRANAQHIEDICRRAHPGDLDRLARPRHVGTRADGDGDAFERMTFLLPDAEATQIGWDQRIKLRDLRPNNLDQIKLSRFAIGQGAKQHAVYDRED